MPSPTWDLALTELLYYIPPTVPVFYCLWRHRKVGIFGWVFLAAFVVLQIVGSGMTLSAGKHGTPSSTAITITNVGLSPLILANAGIMKEWTKLGGLVRTKKHKTLATLCEIVYHFAVIAAIAIYAKGASDATSADADDNSTAKWKAGILLLLLLFLVLCGIFGLLACKIGISASKALFLALSISLMLVGIRLIYQVVATFNEDKGDFNPVTGSIALRVVFQFLPGAFTLLALVTGGIASIELVKSHDIAERIDIPLTSAGVEAGNTNDEVWK